MRPGVGVADTNDGECGRAAVSGRSMDEAVRVALILTYVSNEAGITRERSGRKKLSVVRRKKRGRPKAPSRRITLVFRIRNER